MREAVEEVMAEVLMCWEATEYDPDMVRCFRLALPHAVSLPAVRLYLAGLPPEPATGPLDVYPISEAWRTLYGTSCTLHPSP
eukprot:1584809-Pleurochrysis_carterae.AAC.1